MTSPIPWMPREALCGERAAQPLARMIAEWSETWFPGGGEWAAAHAFQSPRPGDWSILRQEASFNLVGKPKAMIDLAFALLGEHPREELTETDLRLLRRLAARAVDDLGARIETCLSPAACAVDPVVQANWHLGIGPAGRSVLAVGVSQPTLVAIGRTAFAPVRNSPPLLVAARDAIDSVELPTAGRIGTARLSVEQIDAVAVGDILVLDEGAGARVQLIVAGRPSNLFFAIDEIGDRLTLTMQE